MAHFSDGGSVKRIPMPVAQSIRPSIRNFSSGGEVYGQAARQMTVNVTVAPTFMTGDKNSVRQVAADLRTEIMKIDHRYGV